MSTSTKTEEEAALPVTPNDPTSPREVANPGDPGPPIMVPPDHADPRDNPKLPPGARPSTPKT